MIERQLRCIPGLRLSLKHVLRLWTDAGSVQVLINYAASQEIVSELQKWIGSDSFGKFICIEW